MLCTHVLVQEYFAKVIQIIFGKRISGARNISKKIDLLTFGPRHPKASFFFDVTKHDQSAQCSIALLKAYCNFIQL